MACRAGLRIGEHSEYGSWDHHISAFASDAHFDMALIGGNEWLAGYTPVLIKSYAWKAEAVVNARADFGCVGRRSVHSFARFNSCALIATTTVLADISIAPTAGVSKIPHGASTPAASGMAKML